MATEFRRMQQRRGTAAEWAANNIVLLAGEIALQTGPGAGEARAKIGDGVTPFGSLPWVFEVDQTARNGVASLTLSVTSLDTRVDALEAATGSSGALDDLTAAVAQNTADILARQMILPVGTNPGDVLFWSGTDYAATAFAPAMEHGSMFYWNATAREYARVPNGAVGQALILKPGGVPGWGNPSSITVTLENTSIPLAGGASVEAAFNAAAPTIAANAITTVTWEGKAFHYVGAPGTAITTATAADFTLLGRPLERMPYDLAFDFGPGEIAPNAEVGVLTAREIVIPADLVGAVARVNAGDASEPELTLSVEGVDVATLTLTPTGGTWEAITPATPIVVPANSLIVLKAPPTMPDTFLGLRTTIPATR